MEKESPKDEVREEEANGWMKGRGGGGSGRGRKGTEEEANGWMNGGGRGRKGTEEEANGWMNGGGGGGRGRKGTEEEANGWMNGGGGGSGRGRKGMEEEANGWMNGGGVRSGRKGMEEGTMRNMVVRDDTGSMCEQCRAEENAEREETKGAKELSRKLAEHIREMNRMEMTRQKRRMREEKEQEEKERRETEEMMEEEERRKGRKEQRWRDEEEEEEVRWKDEEEEARKGRRKKGTGGQSAELDHWWAGSGSSTFLSLEEDMRSKFGREEAGTKRLDEQLRRNEALRESIERLEQFKQRQRDEDERERSSTREGRAAVMERTRSKSVASRADSGRSGRPKSSLMSQSKVYEAWKEAREADEARYRVLQGGEISREVMLERKRCRRCKKPMEERQYTRYVQRRRGEK